MWFYINALQKEKKVFFQINSSSFHSLVKHILTLKPIPELLHPECFSIYFTHTFEASWASISAPDHNWRNYAQLGAGVHLDAKIDVCILVWQHFNMTVLWCYADRRDTQMVCSPADTANSWGSYQRGGTWSPWSGSGSGRWFFRPQTGSWWNSTLWTEHLLLIRRFWCLVNRNTKQTWHLSRYSLLFTPLLSTLKGPTCVVEVKF